MANAVRLVRPVAADNREWFELTMDALNQINVHIGEEFEIRAVSKSTRRRIPQTAKTSHRRAIPEEDEDFQDELL